MIPNYQAEDRLAYKERMHGMLRLDPGSMAVITVDMQRNYLDLEVAQSPCAADDAAHVLKHAELVLDAARAHGLPVVHAYVNRRRIEAEGGWDISPSKKLKDDAEARPPDRLEGSPQAEVPAFLVKPGDIHITTKKSMDAFLYTELDPLLRRALHVDTVVLMGINTDTCVLSTTFGASNRGYKPIVVSDCVASIRGKDQHWMALELMSRSFVWVLTAEQFVQRLAAASPALAAV